jgi:tetratricopeptide (TPR) repeat protein
MKIERKNREKILRALPPLIVFLTTALVFVPALRNEFVDWDDEGALLTNTGFRGLGVTQLRWMFTTFFLGHYQPLSWLTFAFDYLIWDLNPLGYHLTNLLLHAGNAVLFYFVSLKLLALARLDCDEWRLRIGAAAAALLFALHPLRVESVAWATERRDVLSGLFFLLTLIAYIHAATSVEVSRYTRWMALALGAYILSLLSKATAMTLPAILLILDVYPLKRLGRSSEGWFGPGARKIWLEKLPFAVLAVGCAAAAAAAQYAAGAMDSLSKHTPLQRLAPASLGLFYYIAKTLYPVRVYPMYDLPMTFSPLEAVYVASFTIVLAVTIVLFFMRHRWPAALAAWVYYAVALAPVSGIAQSGSQMVADRYSYVSCLGWALLAGGAIVYVWRRWLAGRTASIFEVLVISFAALMVLTVRQIGVWHDSETLYAYVLAHTPRPSRIAFNNFGSQLAERGRIDDAIPYFRRAVEIDPKFDEARANLGNALAAQGKTAEAMEQYREAVRLKPNSLSAHHSLALALVREGKIDEALEHYQRAVEINPGFLEGQNNFGLLLALKGRYAEAITHLRAALEIDPKFPMAHVNLGDVLIALGQRDEAIEHFRTAIALDPNLASARASLAKALATEPRGTAGR